MAIQIPLHQFEIRFSRLLNFSSIAKEVLSPFVPQATNLNFENEHSTQNSKYTLNFTKECYAIVLSWDRIIFRFEGDPKSLLDNNSIFEEPFLNLFTKLKEHKDFGKIINYLSYTIYINHTEKKKEEILENYIKTNINREGTDRIFYPEDISITLTKNIDGKQLNITYGPYVGIEDLTNRNAFPLFARHMKDLDKPGEMAEVKVYEIASTFNFSKYKEMIRQSNDSISKLW